ncbi:TniQ family protein [Streptomyces sp. NBC_01497]|uniref:TniQ family protein n=1 Tax=Streptomyces sp. NBC_01497 TaxID=2903885 RepID=UPI002E32A993|nr:TniQ family protein [Streptomyces sp. NBC_01497]
MHPLPRSLDPLPDESLPGYLLRLSFRLDLTPGELGRTTGLVSTSGGYLPRRLVLDFPGLSLNEFTQATRLSRSEARLLTLSTWRRNYPPIQSWLPPLHGQAPQIDKWILGGLDRYCPQCLVGDDSPIQREYGGPWKKEWHLGIVFACPQHECFLGHHCPQGGQPPDYDRAPRLIPFDGFRGLHPTACRYPLPATARRLRRPPCGARLDQAPTPALRPAPRLLALQHHLLSLLKTQDDNPEVREYFSDLHLLTALITISWPHSRRRVDSTFAPVVDIEADARRILGGIRVHDTSPIDPIACGAILDTAHSLLQIDSLRDALAEFFDSAFTGTSARAGWAQIFTKYEKSCSQRLRTAAAPLIRTYSPSPGWAAPSPTGYRAENIPAHLEPNWYARHFQKLDGPTDHRILRRIAAIQLVQWTAQASIPEAARYLGVEAEKALYTEDNTHIWMKSTHEVQDFRIALSDLAAELSNRADGLIDYQYRREALRDWSLDPSTWQELTSRLEPPHGKQPVLDDRKRQDPSVFIWVHVTCGEHLFAPRPIEAAQSLDVQQDWARRRNTTWFQLTRPDPMRHYADLRNALTDYAHQFAADIEARTFRPSKACADLRDR